MAVAAPNITLIVILLIAFEISFGLLFIIKRKYPENSPDSWHPVLYGINANNG
ncbi:hypothetical protein ACFLTZ_05820 [Chloroflexota bacterium]